MTLVQATLNYVRSPHRFELVLDDLQLIGKRRLAQKMMGGVLGMSEQPEDDDGVRSALEKQLAEVAISWEL